MLSLCANYYRCLTLLLGWGISVTPVWAENDDVAPAGYQYYKYEGLSFVCPKGWTKLHDNIAPIRAGRSLSFRTLGDASFTIEFYFKENYQLEDLPDIYSYLNSRERLGRNNDRYLVMRKAITYLPYKGVVSSVKSDDYKINLKTSSIFVDLEDVRVFLSLIESKSYDDEYQDYGVERHFATIANSIKIEP